MGISNSNDKVLQSKLDMSSKTGVLNLADQGLKPKAALWTKLSMPVIIEKVRCIDISQNPLKSLPVEIYSLTNVRTLKASKCGLEVLYNLTSCDKLSIIKIDHNELSNLSLDTLPPSIIDCNLSFNRLQELPPALRDLRILSELNLSNNYINNLKGFEWLVSLTALNLDNNAITYLPEAMCSLVKLRTISLANNNISRHVPDTSDQSIPSRFFECCDIENIILTGNTDLRNTDLFNFEGVEFYLERRKKVKDKALEGGALFDNSVFGLS